MSVLIILGVVGFLLVWIYNSIILKKNQVENIFAGVDAVLKKRYDLIPNLVASVSEYMEFEKSTLEKVTQLRSEANRPHLSENEKIALDSKMSAALGSIMVNVENYPQLQSNENIMNLQHNLTEIEAQIAASRRAYNQAVTDYNNIKEMFPTNIVASFMNLPKKDLFVIDANDRRNVDVKGLFRA